MKNFMLILTCLLYISSVNGQAQVNQETWKGELQSRIGAIIEITLELIQQDVDWNGTLSSNSGIYKMPLQDLVYSNETFSFTITQLAVKYEGKLVDNTIEGI